MSLFSRFWKQPQVEASDVAVEVEAQEVPKDLFIEEKEPVIQEKVVQKGLLEEFLKRNHQAIGSGYGYRYQSKEILDQNIEKMKADFLMVLDEKIEELKETLRKLVKKQVMAVGVVASVDEFQAHLIDELKETIAILVNEKDLAQLGQGRIAKPLAEFSLGYKEGLKLAMEEDDFSLNLNMLK